MAEERRTPFFGGRKETEEKRKQRRKKKERWKDGRKEKGRKEGRKEGRKDGSKKRNYEEAPRIPTLEILDIRIEQDQSRILGASIPVTV